MFPICFIFFLVVWKSCLAQRYRTQCVPINGDARRRTEIIINDTGFRKAGIQKRTGIVLGKAKMGKTMANLLKSPARREGENTEGVGIVHGNHYSGFV